MNHLETGTTRSVRGTSEGPNFRIGSLFSGIEGLGLGLEWAGVGRIVYQVEKDPFCRKQLKRHWPHVPRWGAIEEVEAADLPQADVIIGGFPCQDISVAAAKTARAGLRGSRSGLWGHMARIVEAQRPRWVVVENVAKGWKKWLPGVEQALGRLGYATLPIPMEARMVGAPHRRPRIFLLAHADGFALRKHEQRLSGRRKEGVRHGRQTQPLEHGRHAGWEAEPRLSVLDDGIPRGLGAAVWGAIGNAVVPQLAEIVGHVILEVEGA